MTQAPRMGPAEWGLLVLLSLVWGGSFFFFKILVAELPPFTVVLGRVGIAAIALNLMLAARGDSIGGNFVAWRRYLAMGLLNNVIPFSLIAFGESRIASGLAAMLNATTPVFGVLAAHVLTRDERLTPTRLAGVVLGFSGVAVLLGPGVLSGAGHTNLTAASACLLAALTYALAGIYGRRFRGIPPLKVATGQVSASTLLLIPLVLAVDRPWQLAMPTPGAWASLFGIALLCTAFAYLLYFRILAAAGATNLLLVTFLVPVSALLLGGAVLGESIGPAAFAGMGLIGLGLGAIDGRLLPSWRLSRPRANGA